MLIDTYNRQFTYLRLSLTDQCNFRCNYCLPDGYCSTDNEQSLSIEEIQKAVAAFALAGTRKIRLTGGEPTLRKDLAQIIHICKSTPGINTVALTTNGYRLSRQLHEYLDAGLDALNISMDSLRPEMFQLITGHDKLLEIKNAIAMAQARGFTCIKINTVLMNEFNFSEFERFLVFVKAQPITLRFIELMETGDNRPFFSRQHVSGKTLEQQLLQAGWLEIMRSADAGPAKEFTHPDYIGRVGLIMPYSKHFCTTCNRLRLSSKGDLHLCLFAEQGLPLRQYLLRESVEQIAERLQQSVVHKRARHGLDQQHVGATRNLAVLGG